MSATRSHDRLTEARIFQIIYFLPHRLQQVVRTTRKPEGKSTQDTLYGFLVRHKAGSAGQQLTTGRMIVDRAEHLPSPFGTVAEPSIRQVQAVVYAVLPGAGENNRCVKSESWNKQRNKGAVLSPHLRPETWGPKQTWRPTHRPKR